MANWGAKGLSAPLPDRRPRLAQNRRAAEPYLPSRKRTAMTVIDPGSKSFNWTCALIILLTVAVLDYLTGYEFGFFAFYFLPIAFAAWRLGLFSALVTAIFSAMVWFWMDALSGHVYRNSIVAVWNTIIRLISFITIGWGLAWIHDLLLKERSTNAKLRRALAEIKILEGILPICASCKKIRNPNNEWQQMEMYITAHSKAQFSHGLCPECAKRYLAEAGLAGGNAEPR
jgi:hypothetical protein